MVLVASGAFLGMCIACFGPVGPVESVNHAVVDTDPAYVSYRCYMTRCIVAYEANEGVATAISS